MRRLLSSLVVVVCVGSALADAKKEMKDLAGTWQATSVRGLELPDDQAKKISLTIEGDKYTVFVGTDGPDKGTLKVDQKEKLKTIDIVGTEGPNKGKTILAIYQRDGDNLQICYAVEEDKRPTEFKGVAGKSLLITYKRAKKEK